MKSLPHFHVLALLTFFGAQCLPAVPLHAQESYADYKKRLGNSYDDWSKKQDWKHNYFEWGKQNDEEYENWMKESGLDGDDDLENITTDPRKMLLSLGNTTSTKKKVDSLNALIAQLQQSQAQNELKKQREIELLQAEVNKLGSQNQQMNQTLTALRRLGNFKIWAVVVGISDYNNRSSKLSYCDDDAYKIHSFLKSPEGGALPDSQIRLLIDEEATGDRIMYNLIDLTAKAGPKDVFFFYFAGHGSVTSLIAQDFDFDTAVNGRISHASLNELIKNCKARLNLCVIDACHSGTIAMLVGNTSGTSGEYKVLDDKTAAPPLGYQSIASLESTVQFYQALEKEKKGVVYILSSKSEETTVEYGSLRQGVFSFHFIRGLAGMADYNGDRIISVTEAFDYTRRQVISATKGRQNPVITGQYSHTLPLAVVRTQ